VPANVQCHHGSWLKAEKDDLTQLAKHYSRLGHSAILGKLTYHQSSSFAVSIGPLSYSVFSEFLPNDNLGSSYFVFKEFVLAYFSCPPHYQICLKVNKNEIPPTHLNKRKQLGYNTWLYSKVSDHYENNVWIVGAR
jgi:predicted component of type VI protein secretion system